MEILILNLCLWFLLLLPSPLCCEQPPRYLLYTVNPGEGFNLRRDVHMRAATLVKSLREDDNWVLVLPPWVHLYHWNSRFGQTGLKWERFFDIEALNEYVPSIEFEEYVQRMGNIVDKVYTLQYYAEGWGEGGFVEKYDHRSCIEQPSCRRASDGSWTGYLGNKKLGIGHCSCVSVQGFTHTLVPLINEDNSTRSVLVERLEKIMHSKFGGLQYWAARYSMVYAGNLREAGNDFMKKSLSYDPGEGNGRQPPRNSGGAFLAVHLRRRDYITARPNLVPSLKDAASQINTLRADKNLDTVFLATDAPLSEKEALSSMVEGLLWYQPSQTELVEFGDGGVAIIDQWISAHAQYFVGSSESTFSFRIREDRQLMEFSPESTFNQLCKGPNPYSCEPPSKWLIDLNVWTMFNNKEKKHRTDEL